MAIFNLSTDANRNSFYISREAALYGEIPESAHFVVNSPRVDSPQKRELRNQYISILFPLKVVSTMKEKKR